MSKIDIETVKFILQRNEPDVRKVAAVMQEIELERQAEEHEKANRPPPVKKQYAIVLADINGNGITDKAIVGWVVQIPEDEALYSAPQRIIKAAHEFNTTPKGRRMPIETVGEACECVSAKFFKEQKIWVKTKVPVLAVPTPNRIPTEEGE